MVSLPWGTRSGKEGHPAFAGNINGKHQRKIFNLFTSLKQHPKSHSFSRWDWRGWQTERMHPTCPSLAKKSLVLPVQICVLMLRWFN